MNNKGYVTRIKRVVVSVRRKFDAKLGPTQVYSAEKALVLKAVKDYEFESISAFCREAVREKLEALGYDVPPDSDFSKTPETLEAEAKGE